jgi:hypothetical protein
MHRALSLLRFRIRWLTTWATAVIMVIGMLAFTGPAAGIS